jgi:signal transduction histidine kinase
LTEVIFEYHILRETIFQVLENDGPLAEIQRDIILSSIEQAVNDAAVEFSEQHTEIQQVFVNTLTHDLKNPISAAKMNAQMILRLPDLPIACHRSASRVIGSMNRLESMIHDLLDSSRLRAGERLSVQYVECDLDAVIREIVDEMAVIHGDRFEFESSGARIGRWGCDGLQRAVENLVGNAVKYGTPETPILISLKHGTSGIELKVHNEGKPIPEKEIPLLFQNYRRSKSAQEGTQIGWGLGLTLVKGVVDAQNGRVWVESAKGKGTSFIVEIPFTQESTDSSLSPAR